MAVDLAPATDSASSVREQRGFAWTPDAALAVLIGVSLVLRLIWSASIGVCNDEAYHYLFTVYPDWSYFDHPPMTMWVAWLGLTACGGWVHPLSLRLGFVLMTAGSTYVMARLTTRWFGAWAGFYAALLLNLTIYYGGAGGFALPDPPLLFFGLLTVTTLANALLTEKPGVWPWIWVGLAFAGTLVSKYHAIFLPMGAFLYIVVTPSARHWLRRPGPYVALAIGSLGFAPVLIWNAQHDWLSFAFQGSRAVGMEFRLDGLLTTILGPAIYLFPWTWLLLVCLLFQRLRDFSALAGIERLLVCLAVVPLGVFLAISCVKPTLPHWTLIAFVILLPLAGAKCAAWSVQYPVLMRRGVVSLIALMLVIASLAVAQGRLGIVSFPPEADPLLEASGWDSVAPELKARGLVGKPGTFLFTDRWYESGQLAFALRNEVPVYCYRPNEAHGFAQWHDPKAVVGLDGYFVTTQDSPEYRQALATYFTGVEHVADFPMTRGGVPFRTIHVWRFTQQQRPFPFRYGASGS